MRIGRRVMIRRDELDEWIETLRITDQVMTPLKTWSPTIVTEHASQ